MDYYNQYNITSMNDQKKKQPNFVNKITPILLSVSVFTFLLSQSSLFPILVDTYENLFVLDFSNFKFKFFTYTTERNCIFLLFNGILLLIIQSSGLISRITPVISGPKPARVEVHHEERDNDDDESVKFQEKEKKGVQKDEILEVKTEEIQEIEEKTGEIQEIVEIEEFVEIEEIEEREEEGGMNVEELNKKCEDFIKKMKKLIQN